MDSCSLLDLYPIIFKGSEFVMSLSSSSVRIANMKTTQTTLFTLFILVLLISSLLLVDGYMPGNIRKKVIVRALIHKLVL